MSEYEAAAIFSKVSTTVTHIFTKEKKERIVPQAEFEIH